MKVDYGAYKGYIITFLNCFIVAFLFIGTIIQDGFVIIGSIILFAIFSSLQAVLYESLYKEAYNKY